MTHERIRKLVEDDAEANKTLGTAGETVKSAKHCCPKRGVGRVIREEAEEAQTPMKNKRRCNTRTTHQLPERTRRWPVWTFSRRTGT